MCLVCLEWAAFLLDSRGGALAHPILFPTNAAIPGIMFLSFCEDWLPHAGGSSPPTSNRGSCEHVSTFAWCGHKVQRLSFVANRSSLGLGFLGFTRVRVGLGRVGLGSPCLLLAPLGGVGCAPAPPLGCCVVVPTLAPRLGFGSLVLSLCGYPYWLKRLANQNQHKRVLVYRCVPHKIPTRIIDSCQFRLNSAT